jgi:hypothetical protein
MNVTESNHTEPRDLPRPRSITPSASRDQTRIARARWAEVVLKMRTRAKSGRLAETLTALRMRDRFF